jgi:hypothetical protein
MKIYVSITTQRTGSSYSLVCALFSKERYTDTFLVNGIYEMEYYFYSIKRSADNIQEEEGKYYKPNATKKYKKIKN